MSRKLYLTLRTILTLVALVGVFSLWGQADLANAQDPEDPAMSYNNIRGLFYTDDGTLYMVDAGTGGTVPSLNPLGEVVGGGSGVVYKVAADGSVTAIIYGLPSIAAGPEVIGAHDIHVTDDAIWLVLGQGGNPDAGVETGLSPFAFSVVALDRESLRVIEFIDLYAYEAEVNPDGNAIDSNPTRLAVGQDGTVYIADAGANAVLAWTADAGLSTFAVWNDNPVPTSVSVGPDGSVYVGFLTGFPFLEGSSRIEQYSPDGELIATFEGLTLVVDVVVTAEGEIYAVEFARFDLEAGGFPWLADSGRVVQVSADGLTPVLEGLNYPYALVQTPSGGWAVSVNAAFMPAGSSEVMFID